MPLLPGEWECIFKFSVPGASGDVLIILGGPTTSAPAALAEDAYNAMADGPLDVMSNTVALLDVTAHVGQDPPPDAVTVFAGSAVGSISDTLYSPNVAVLVSKETGLSGRANRGRIFMPGVNESQVQGDGQLTSAALAAIQTEWGNFTVSMSAGGHNLGILHKAFHRDEIVIPEVDRAAVAATPLLAGSLGLVVQRKLATQRNRLRD